ncbi:MAG: hypothetical protein M1469_06165 [Bacteroidetes bacterium]|nr:hypothetical protein [Bacteroidota bacterium]
MPEGQDQSGFSEEYAPTDKTESATPRPAAPAETVPTLNVEIESYGVGKPKRQIILAKITHDKRQ